MYRVQSSRMSAVKKVKRSCWIRILGNIRRFILPKFSMKKAIRMLENNGKSKRVSYVLNSPFVNSKGIIYHFPITQTIKKPFLDFYVNVPKDYHIILEQKIR